MTPTPTQNRRGIIAMVAAMAVFTANDTAMKLALVQLPVGQAMAVRGLFALVICFALIFASGHAGKVKMLVRPVVVMRAAFEATGAIAFFTCLKLLPLADVVAITQATPLIIAAYCAATGLAQMGWRRWAAVIVGFSGVLVVVRPGASAFDPTMLVAVVAAMLVAARDITTRAIPSGIPSMVVLFSTSVAVLLSGGALGATETWVPLDRTSIALLGAASLLVTLAHYCAITAFRDVDVAVVSPFRYTVLIWAIVAGMLVFGEYPNGLTLVGAALIAGSGLYTVHRERIQATAAAGR
jgi:drug/metabolite transporter (DMT)-like permease